MIFEQEIEIWPKVLVKKLTMQCTKMKTHTDACCPCKINKTSNFSPILVTSIHKTDSFRLHRFIWDSHIFQKLSLVFCQSVDKHPHFSHIEVTLIIKSDRFVGSSTVYHVVCIIFILVQCTQLELRNFGHSRSNNS